MSDLVDRLRGKYRVPINDGLGPAGGEEPDNPTEFVRSFKTPPIQHEAAARIEALEAALAALRPAQDAEGWVMVPREPTEAMWGGLARAIMMWLRFPQPTPRKLFDHLKMTGEQVPEWMNEEGELRALDHVPSKGTCCVLIYRAMIEDAASPPRTLEGK